MNALSPAWFRALRAISRVTLQEIIRDKVLYNVIFFGVIVIGLGFLGFQMTYVQPERILLDFSMSAVALSCAIIACLSGSTLLSREIERRTAFVAFSHPISRSQFLLGKFAGLALVLLLNWLLLSALFIGVIALVTPAVWLIINTTVFWGLCFGLLQSLVLAGLTLFFSTFSTPSLSIMCTTGLFLIGTNLTNLRNIAQKTESPALARFMTGVSHALPNLEHFNLGLFVTYGLPVEARKLFYTTLYGLVLIGILLALASLILQKREL